MVQGSRERPLPRAFLPCVVRVVRAGAAAAALAVLGCTLLTGCGRHSAFDGARYQDRAQGMDFRLAALGPDWERLSSTHGLLAFRNDARRASILVNGRCGQDGDDVPLGALTAHLFLRFTEREVESEEIVPFDGREAMHTVMSAKLDGVAKKFDVWVMKKDGCVYDMIFIAEPARFDAGVGEFRKFVGGFSTARGDG